MRNRRSTTPDRRFSSRLLTAMMMVAGIWSIDARAAGATSEPPDASDVVIVDSSDPGSKLSHGSSDTDFALRLPEGAACPGDSANDQWRVQSFIVPVSEDPSTVYFGAVGPEGDTQFALYTLDTRPFSDILTQQNPGPGKPGLISAPPPFSFAIFPPGTLPDGRYRIGLACTYFRDPSTRYWDTEIVIATSLDGGPAQFEWHLPGVPANPDEPSNRPGPLVILAACGLGASALGWYAWQRHLPHSITPSKEPQ